MFEEGESCRSLQICCHGREESAPHKLSDVIPVLNSLVAATESDVDEVDTSCIDDSECMGIWVCTDIPFIVTELYAQTGLSEAALLEEGSSTLLQMC